MDHKRNEFDRYEFVGLIVPGTLVLCGLAVFLGKYDLLTEINDISIGGLGLLMILAYVVGHLTDIAGEFIQKVWWARHGGPTDQILSGHVVIFDSSFMPALSKQMEKWFAMSISLPKKGIPRTESYAIARRMYVIVSASGKAARIDSFNRTYGLLRGLAAGFFLLAIVAAIQFRAINWSENSETSNIWIALLLLLASICAFYRMVQFGWNYATELFVEFVQT